MPVTERQAPVVICFISLLQVFDVLNINDEGISAVAGTANNAGSAKSKHFNNLLSNPARFLDNWPVKNAGQQILKVLEIVQGFKPDSESFRSDIVPL